MMLQQSSSQTMKPVEAVPAGKNVGSTVSSFTLPKSMWTVVSQLIAIAVPGPRSREKDQDLAGGRYIPTTWRA